jgi:hypothetical protein
MLGAEAIAVFLYGKAGPKELRDVYRNPAELPFFKHGSAIAGLKSSIRAALHEAQRAAQTERQQKKELEARKVVKPRRARLQQGEKRTGQAQGA